MTKQDLVDRTKAIRKDVLKLTQQELAEAIGSSQAIVSRMELEGAGTIDYLINLFNFYEEKGISSFMVWLPDFNVSMLMPDGQNNNKTEIEKILESVKKDLDKLSARVSQMV